MSREERECKSGRIAGEESCGTHQLTADMAVRARHAQDEAGQNFSMNGEGEEPPRPQS